eukprot:6972369-Pyramimonas_sp.AAC.1
MLEGLRNSHDLKEHISVNAPLGVTICGHVTSVTPLNAMHDSSLHHLISRTQRMCPKGAHSV